MKEKILSLVIPMYNSRNYIEKCLDSLIIERNIGQIEIIVVNDGSTDGCEKIVEKYQKKYPDTIKLISQPNGGHGAAVDKGIESCCGTYFKVIDADDWVINEKLDKFVDILIGIRETDVVVCGFELYDIQTKVTTIISTPTEDVEYYSMKSIMENWMPYRNIFTLHGMTYHTQFYRAHGIPLPHKVFYDDAIYITIAASMADSICVINQNLYVYRVGDQNQSVSKSSRVKRIKHVETVIQIMCDAEKIERTKAGQSYWQYKTRSVITDFFVTAFLRYDDKKEGRKEAKCMLQKIIAKHPNIADKIIGRYRLLLIMSYLHMGEEQFDKLLALRK